MFEYIQHIDEFILQFIHVKAANARLDWMIPFLRNPYFWAPVYLFLLAFMWKNYRANGLWWCAFFFVTFVFCDFISASLIKPLVHRIRPCNSVNYLFTIRELVKCGSGYSFPSSHATNHAGLSLFIIITLQQKHKIAAFLAILWVLLVCYAQLYVCVHYPSDILSGLLLGSLIGLFFGKYFNVRFGRFI
jgi:membrane-associated phospholipid phosphatase